jgi:hypothetical protein
LQEKRDKEMKPKLRKIAHGFSYSASSYNAYDVNGYRFHTHDYTWSRLNWKIINSGVLCEGSDGLHYYGRSYQSWITVSAKGSILLCSNAIGSTHIGWNGSLKLGALKLNEALFMREMMSIFWQPKPFKFSIFRTRAKTPKNVYKAGMLWSLSLRIVGRLYQTVTITDA